MAPTLGKRKRTIPETPEKKETSDDDDTGTMFDQDAQEIFRRHFEAQFSPLQVVKKPQRIIEEDLENVTDDEPEWSGISEDEETAVQVIEHTDSQARIALMSKEQLKAFMSSKPPINAPVSPLVRDKTGAAIEDDDASESANLKKDLALQRLLTESHLLESSTNPTLSGNNRHKATDLRMQALGSKTSILKQEKMPMSHRKGIVAKQNEREDKRRKEARENGIILEKAKMGKKTSEGKRDRGVGAPGVGKFSGGTLKLSKRDIFDIEGPRKTASGRGGRGGGRGRGRGKRGK